MAPDPIRMARLAADGGAFLMVPLDHGVSMGPLPGLAPPDGILAAVAPYASCVTVHKGLVRHAVPHAHRLGVLLHLSASTDLGPDPHDKRLVATVTEAARSGCDGVSVHVNIGSRTEADQLADLGRVSTACQEHGMPLAVMAYPRGPGIGDPRDPVLVAHAARVAAELGADLVKVPYTDADTFGDVVQAAGVPVLVAGGAAGDPEALLSDLGQARRQGAAGASVGRHVFAAPDPGALMRRVAETFR